MDAARRRIRNAKHTQSGTDVYCSRSSRSCCRSVERQTLKPTAADCSLLLVFASGFYLFHIPSVGRSTSGAGWPIRYPGPKQRVLSRAGTAAEDHPPRERAMLLHYGCRNTKRRVNETRRSILSPDCNTTLLAWDIFPSSSPTVIVYVAAAGGRRHTLNVRPSARRASLWLQVGGRTDTNCIGSWGVKGGTRSHTCLVAVDGETGARWVALPYDMESDVPCCVVLSVGDVARMVASCPAYECWNEMGRIYRARSSLSCLWATNLRY